MQAYDSMRRKYASEYHKTIDKNNLLALGSAGFAILATAFFFLLGYEIRETTPGQLFLVISVFTFIGAAGAIGHIIRNRREQKRQPVNQPLRPGYLGITGEKKLPRELQILVFLPLLILIPTCRYTKGQGLLNTSALEISSPKVLYKKPWQVKINSKNSHYFTYKFSFFEDPHIYEFEEDYIKYRSANFYLDSLEVGDTLAIHYDQADRSMIEDRYYPHTISIYNVSKGGIPYADLENRNKAISQSNKEMIWTGTAAAAFLALLIIAISLYRIWRYKKLSAARIKQRLTRQAPDDKD
ncbi:MAG: hypothetical protein J7527_11800, partial [Chitinophagaceae bacterium]|nr:hypothetical protein [Chitinophagaceae bacterium]